MYLKENKQTNIKTNKQKKNRNNPTQVSFHIFLPDL